MMCFLTFLSEGKSGVLAVSARVVQNRDQKCSCRARAINASHTTHNSSHNAITSLQWRQDGNTMSNTHEGYLPLQGLPKSARKAHIFNY